MGKSTVLTRVISVFLLAFLTTPTLVMSSEAPTAGSSTAGSSSGAPSAEDSLRRRARSMGIPVEVLRAEEAAASASGASNSSSTPTSSSAGSSAPAASVAEPDTCSVCLAPLGTDESVVRRLPCGHAFHIACVSQWIEDHATCPTCVQPVQPTGTWPRVRYYAYAPFGPGSVLRDAGAIFIGFVSSRGADRMRTFFDSNPGLELALHQISPAITNAPDIAYAAASADIFMRNYLRVLPTGHTPTEGVIAVASAFTLFLIQKLLFNRIFPA